MLDAAGLSPVEEHVYGVLIELPSASEEDVAARLSLEVAQARQALGTLEAKGLASRTTGRAPRFLAAPPDVAIEPLLLQQRLRIEQTRAAVAQLTRVYRSGHQVRASGELVEVVEGVSAIRQRVDQLQQSAAAEVRAFVRPPYLVPDYSNDMEATKLKEGVRYRMLYDRALFEQDGWQRMIATDIARGEEPRVVERLPMKLVIADDNLAFVPLVEPPAEDPGPRPAAGDRWPTAPASGSTAMTTPAVAAGVEPTCVLVHSSGLLDALVALFESEWRQSARLRPDAGPADLLDAPTAELEPADRRVLSLLQAGLTDEAISKQLDTSPRTVQRRIRHLMDVTGAGTRFQLGWRATQRGWL